MSEKLEEITEREILFSLISGEGTHKAITATRTMSVRLPIQLLMKVEQLSKGAGTSRNKMFEHLLELAFSEYEKEFSVSISKEIWDKYVTEEADQYVLVNDFEGDEK